MATTTDAGRRISSSARTGTHHWLPPGARLVGDRADASWRAGSKTLPVSSRRGKRGQQHRQRAWCGTAHALDDLVRIRRRMLQRRSRLSTTGSHAQVVLTALPCRARPGPSRIACGSCPTRLRHAASRLPAGLSAPVPSQRIGLGLGVLRLGLGWLARIWAAESAAPAQHHCARESGARTWRISVR